MLLPAVALARPTSAACPRLVDWPGAVLRSRSLAVALASLPTLRLAKEWIVIVAVLRRCETRRGH